jgi:hypothetical protein
MREKFRVDRFKVNVSDYHTKKRTPQPETIDRLANGSFLLMNRYFAGMSCKDSRQMTNSRAKYE